MIKAGFGLWTLGSGKSKANHHTPYGTPPSIKIDYLSGLRFAKDPTVHYYPTVVASDST